MAGTWTPSLNSGVFCLANSASGALEVFVRFLPTIWCLWILEPGVPFMLHFPDSLSDSTGLCHLGVSDLLPGIASELLLLPEPRLEPWTASPGFKSHVRLQPPYNSLDPAQMECVKIFLVLCPAGMACAQSEHLLLYTGDNICSGEGGLTLSAAIWTKLDV